MKKNQCETVTWIKTMRRALFGSVKTNINNLSVILSLINVIKSSSS